MASKNHNIHTDQWIGANLRQIRLAMGISQQRLAGALGISFQQIQKYETGSNRISVSMLVSIANYMKLPIFVFFPSDWQETTPKTTDGALPYLVTLPVEELEFLQQLRPIKDHALNRSILALLTQINRVTASAA